MPSSGGSATFEITAEASQALRTFKEVTRSATDMQRQTAAGTAGGAPKFLNGLNSYVARQGKEFEQHLNRIHQAAAKLKSGDLLPKDFVPGFKGGTAAQAANFAGNQAQRNIVSEIGRRAAESKIAAPQKLTADLLGGFQQQFGAVARKAINDLNSQRPDIAGIGKAGSIQFERQTPRLLQMVDEIQRNVTETLRETAAATARMRAEARAAERAASGNLPSTSRPLDPIQRVPRREEGGSAGAGGGGGAGATGGGAPGSSDRPAPLVFDREPRRTQTPEQANERILQEAYRRNREFDQARGQLVARAEREQAAAFNRQSQLDRRRGELETRAAREQATEFTRREQAARRRGELQTRAEREQDTYFARREQAARRRGELETRAAREQDTEFARRQARAQRAGVTEERARRENINRDQTRAITENDRRTARNLRGADGERLPGTIPVGGSHLADVRGAQLEMYRRTADGFRRLGRDSEEFVHNQSRLIQQLGRQGRPGIGGAIAQGLASSGFGGGGGGEHGIIEGLARSGATTAKYAAMGAALFGVIGALQQAGQEFLNFDDSVTELEIAFQSTDKSVVASQGFLNELADSASEAGANVGEAMDVAASAIRAFGDASGETTQRSTEEIKDLAITFAREASRIAILTKTSLTDASGNLKATALGFDVPIENASRITDALANAKLVGGGDEKQIGQGVANISVAAKEAGFSLEETGNIISDIVAKTDQGGTLVAQRLSRAFSIVGGTAGQTAIRRLNEQLPTGQKIAQGAGVTTAEQVKQLSAVYGDLDEAQRKTLNNSLGGTANARELIILLSDASRLTKASNLDAAGKGAAEYEHRLENVRSVLAQIKGEITNLIVQLTNSGLLTPLGIMLEITLNLTKGLRTLAETFNAIPGKIRAIAGGLVGLLVILKAIQAVSRAGGITAFARRQEERYLPAAAQARRVNDIERARQARVAGLGGIGSRAAEETARREAAAARRAAIRNVGSQGVGDATKSLARTIQAGGRSVAGGFSDWKARMSQARNAAGAAGAGFFGRQVAGANAPITAPPVFGPQLAPDTLRNNRLSRGLSSGRAQLNQSGLFGGLAIASVGVLGFVAALNASKKINKAAEEFGKLAKLPPNFGVEELRENAKNLRAAAQTMEEASSGFFGTISNALRGNETGARADDARNLADVQERAANRLEQAAKQARLGDTGEAGQVQIVDTPDQLINARRVPQSRSDISAVGSTIDFSSGDKLTESLDALSKSGRNATDIMAAFQDALKGIGTEGEAATRKLDSFENETVASAVSGQAIATFQQLIPQDLSVSASEFGAKNPDLAARLDTTGKGFLLRNDTTAHLVPGVPGARDAIRRSQALRGVNQGELETSINETVNSFLKSGKDINDPKQKEVLRAGLIASISKIIPDQKIRDELIESVLGGVKRESKTVRSVTDSSASFAELAAAIDPLAQAAGAEAVVNKVFATPTRKQVGESAELTSAKEVLKQKKDGLVTLTNKALTSDSDQDALDALVAEVRAATISVADATADNMRAQFELLQASKPPENTTQNLKDRLAEIKKEFNQDNLSDQKRKELEAEQKALQQQLPGAQIADKFAGRRAKVDSRDTIALDKINEKQIQAELDDFINRGVEGKALADKQIELDDAKRKTLNDQADLALATQLSTLDPNSAVDSAIGSLKEAKNNLAKALAGSKEYVEAQTTYRNAQKALAVAQLAAANIHAQLGIDLSNPVQTARLAEKAAKDALALAKDQNESPDVIDQKRLDVRNAQLQSQSAAFQQFLTNVQNADQLGDISHKAYLGLLQGRLTALQAELALMDPSSNGYQQIKDQITQLRLALKTGADELSGQFNLGDIKIPTVYEVRRALKAGDRGQILANNAATSTAGNVTNDTSTRNVILNGVPIQQVLALIEDLFGVKARTKAARRIP